MSCIIFSFGSVKCTLKCFLKWTKTLSSINWFIYAQGFTRNQMSIRNWQLPTFNIFPCTQNNRNTFCSAAASLICILSESISSSAVCIRYLISYSVFLILHFLQPCACCMMSIFFHCIFTGGLLPQRYKTNYYKMFITKALQNAKR